MERKDTSTNQSTVLNPEALNLRLEQGLHYFKNAKYGKALVCFREVAKNLKTLDPSKQRVLVKVLQSVGTACLKKAKYKKAIKSAKITIKVLNSIEQAWSETAVELAHAQEKLLAALQGYLQHSIEQHQHFSRHEINQGKLPKANLLQMSREGFIILKRPLLATDALESKIKVKCTKTNLVFKDTLEKLLDWMQVEEKKYREKHNSLHALFFCKIAIGPLREAFYLSTPFTGEENKIIQELESERIALEKQVREEAAQALELGRENYQQAMANQTAVNFQMQMEQAKKYLKDAVNLYSQLEQPDKAQQALGELVNSK